MGFDGWKDLPTPSQQRGTEDGYALTTDSLYMAQIGGCR